MSQLPDQGLSEKTQSLREEEEGCKNWRDRYLRLGAVSSRLT
jgi:hypothetical protein